jgi:hypothetical protein
MLHIRLVNPPQPHWFFNSSNIFSPVAAIAIELAKARRVLDKRGRENRISVNILAGADIEEPCLSGLDGYPVHMGGW